MEGQPIAQAVNCLQLFLRSLPSSCLFNIVGFGSNFYKIFPMSAPYNGSYKSNLLLILLFDYYFNYLINYYYFYKFMFLLLIIYFNLYFTINTST